jgi:hypothetical protein
MQTILYARVSTVDQTLDHQRTQAEAAGFEIDHVLADHGVSGVSTRLKTARRAGGCSTCSGEATRWWCGGWTVWGGTIRT